MKNFKSMKYAKHDGIKGYKTGMLEPIRKGIQESSAVSRMTEWQENQSLAEYLNSAELSPIGSIQINELRKLIKSEAWEKKDNKNLEE